MRPDAKQVRRRLACVSLRIHSSLRDIERRLNVTFAAAQKFEKALAELEDKTRVDIPDQILAKAEREALESQLADLRADAVNLSDLATWYKAGFETLTQTLTQMTREADTYISWYDTVEGE